MSQKLNIVFILNDHQGYGEMSGGPKIQRPYFEKLANEGVKSRMDKHQIYMTLP